MVEGLRSIWDNQAVSVLDRARPYMIDPALGDVIGNYAYSGGKNDMPRFSNLDGNQNNRMSDRWIEDATYLRIQNISLSYTLPKNDFYGKKGLRFD